jgi:Bifunctional DNA primase/polymerase, N-terminal
MIASGFINAAGELCAHGFKVFPLVAGGKIPLTDRGCLDATDDEHILAEWHDRWPNANVGVATGKESDCCVIDVDVKDGAGGSETIAVLARAGKRLPRCPASITPSGGEHLWFAHVPGLKNIAGQTKGGRGIGRGVDFRTTGGYVVAPPSRLIACTEHGTGEYRWTISPDEFDELPPLPDWAITMLRGEWRPRPKYQPIRSDDATLAKLEPLARTVANAKPTERNATLFWAACRAAEAGLPQSAIENRLLTAALCAGPNRDKIIGTIRSGIRTIRGDQS